MTSQRTIDCIGPNERTTDATNSNEGLLYCVRSNVATFFVTEFSHFCCMIDTIEILTRPRSQSRTQKNPCDCSCHMHSSYDLRLYFQEKRVEIACYSIICPSL